MKYFDSVKAGQLNQLTNNLRPSNEISDDDEPGLQQVLIKEARQRQLPKESSKIETSQIGFSFEIKTQIEENFSL